MLRYLSAGESHGKAIVAILEGMPAGVRLDLALINSELKRRQQGPGRGRRMRIEKDRAQVIAGTKSGLTLGSPIALLIANKDSSIESLHKVLSPRPGHADLAGLLKYGFTDIRDVLERASARSTVATVAVGAICRIFLNEFSINISSRVCSIGAEVSTKGMKEKIAEAARKKDTLGGIFEVSLRGVPAGLGSYVHPDRRLDGRLAAAIMSIPGIKAVEVGLGFAYADKFGSQAHDAIYYSKEKGYLRRANNAGGIEGGVSNGQEIKLSVCMKPISTLMKPLDSVNIKTRKFSRAAVERSDICVVGSAGAIAESASAFVLAACLLEKFGGDSLVDIRQAYRAYLKRIK
ncbi:MAG: chorismate synthase [Candidatus Omnitrophota bacterium]